jgi:hypothetical protein
VRLIFGFGFCFASVGDGFHRFARRPELAGFVNFSPVCGFSFNLSGASSPQVQDSLFASVDLYLVFGFRCVCQFARLRLTPDSVFLISGFRTLVLVL